MKYFNKDNLHIKFLRRFYKIEGDLDEYTLSEINRFGNNVFMISYTSFFALAILWFFTEIELFTWFIFFFAFLPPLFHHRLIKKLGLDKMEVEKKQLKQARKALFHRTLFQTLFFAIFWGMIIGGHAYIKRLEYRAEYPVIAFWVWAILTTLFFIGRFFKNRKKIRIID